MTKQKYIGIENELKSFDNDGYQGFNSDYFQKLLIDKYFVKSSTAIRSNIGNGYYIDGEEIEIITPPIALNKGFASRLTDALILGRNYIIKNTPELIHTGYSMHWNLTHDEYGFSVDDNSRRIINSLSIPFQLFGLTPASCGFNLRAKYNNRFELLGDSLTNNDQIKAAALLLGAYSSAMENSNFIDKNIFPILISDVDYNTSSGNYVNNMLTDGRYTNIKVRANNKTIETQAQNILELFYEWISPFVYKLGDRSEISNLEAFVKGEKKLEMDDLKYFKMLAQQGGVDEYTYMPVDVMTPGGIRSPILKITEGDEIKVPIEGILLGKYASNTVSNEEFVTREMEWENIRVDVQEERTEEKRNLFGLYTYDHKYFECVSKNICGVHDIYRFAEKYQDKKYYGSRDLGNIKPNNIITSALENKLQGRIEYIEDKDLSA